MQPENCGPSGYAVGIPKGRGSTFNLGGINSVRAISATGRYMRRRQRLSIRWKRKIRRLFSVEQNNDRRQWLKTHNNSIANPESRV